MKYMRLNKATVIQNINFMLLSHQSKQSSPRILARLKRKISQREASMGVKKAFITKEIKETLNAGRMIFQSKTNQIRLVCAIKMVISSGGNRHEFQGIILFPSQRKAQLKYRL